MQALLTAIVVWLSANFDLPAHYEHPRILRMSSIEMTNSLYQSSRSNRPGELNLQENPGQLDKQRTVASLYNNVTKTIYLTPQWTGRTPAELSVLVHEMVHHLQNVSGERYACPQEREKLAYQAQEKWLSLFGRSLSSEFELDRFSLLLATGCME